MLDTVNKVQGALAPLVISTGNSVAVATAVPAVVNIVSTPIEVTVETVSVSVETASALATPSIAAVPTATPAVVSAQPARVADRPVIAAKLVSGGPGQSSVVNVQLPQTLIGAGSSGVVVQLPSSVTSAVAGGAQVKLSAMDNSAAPAWVQYSPQQGGLIVGNVPAGVLPTQIRLLVGQQQLTVQLSAQ